MILYLFPLLISALGAFFVLERQHIIQLLPGLSARSLFYVGACYFVLGVTGAGILYFMGEKSFIIWVISTLLLTAILPVFILLSRKH
ncbi:hypothetical protein NHG23_06455 [Aerococcaceae bacterium NML190073]|nr:hypothetical protein [Aerococcaceae bacterium NML190073]MCW6667523.1 hypothetical protein [Aerococcaceae bacterium NML190938]MCW6674580.1 hypothetical protein [Aerococcaceae bacterium NML171108]